MFSIQAKHAATLAMRGCACSIKQTLLRKQTLRKQKRITWRTRTKHTPDEPIADHAGHIDHATARLEHLHIGQAATCSRHERLGKDVVEVMTRVQTNNDELKAIQRVQEEFLKVYELARRNDTR